MMKILTILLFCSQAVFAGSYYVSNVGSDANSGAIGNPFATIGKANTVAISGDFIYLESGNVWNEMVYPVAGVTYSSYGTGSQPLITGFQSTTVANVSGNIWAATISTSVKNQNTVMLNGILAHKARMPNTGFSGYANPASHYWIRGSGLTGSPNYAGVEAVIRTQSWVTDVLKVSSQNVDTLFLRDSSYYTPQVFQYFLQNDIRFLDVANEYVYDSTLKKLSVYSVTAPTVLFSNIDTLVYLNNKNNVTFDGITFSGSNGSAIRFDTSSHITIINCNFLNNGRNAIYASGSQHSSIRKDTIKNTLNDAVYLISGDTYATIDSVWVQNAGTIDGMAANLNDAASGIVTWDNYSNVTNCRIDSIGYNGLRVQGKKDTAYRNFISDYCLNKADGGGIYTDYATGQGMVIKNNIVINGSSNGGNTAAGIYLDGNTDSVTVIGNTVYKSYFQTVFFHYPHNIIFEGNTIVDSTSNPFQYSDQGVGYNYTIKNNIFYQKDSTKAAMYYASSPSGTNYIDSNYVIRPLKDDNKYWLGSSIIKYSQPAWVTATGFDANSKGMPANTYSPYPLFFYNPTISDSTISLGGLYIDAKGALYNNTATVASFGSLILFKANYEIYNNKPDFRIGNLIFKK